MAILKGFAPVGSPNPRILILGSFPSVRSLEQGQYYGHPQNHFWPLIAAGLGRQTCPEDYEERLALLREAGIALWDVLSSCEREGSLDTSISNERANDIPGFLAGLAGLRALGLNGGKAAECFKARYWPAGPALEIGRARAWKPPFLGGRTIILERLPSTSPIPTAAYRRARDKAPVWEAFLAMAAGSGTD